LPERDHGEVVVGEVLANALSVGLGDEVLLAVGDKQARAKVVGVFRSQTQSDAELLVPVETVNMLVEDGRPPSSSSSSKEVRTTRR
jgi:ABC-type lipoprotein release transport system permease subunit